MLTNVWKLAGGGEHGAHRAALFPQQRGWKARPEPGACRRVPRAATLLGRAPTRGWWRLQPGHVPQRSHLGGFSHSPELGAVAHRPALPSFRTQGPALPSTRPRLTSSCPRLPRAGRALGWESGDVGSVPSSATHLLCDYEQGLAPLYLSFPSHPMLVLSIQTVNSSGQELCVCSAPSIRGPGLSGASWHEYNVNTTSHHHKHDKM